jgi:hypothetical protein
MLLDEIYELKGKLDDERNKHSELQNEMQLLRTKGTSSAEVNELKTKLL